jgi:hypothetical protein
MNEINSVLLQIRPPSNVPASPRSLFEWPNWRAHEFMFFILYYSLIVFRFIMNDEQYQHISMLVASLEVLLAREIEHDKLIYADTLLKQFVDQCEKIYEKSILKSGFHELIHLAPLTRQFGPLNLISSYPFEELNRKITRSIKGQFLIGDEFIKLYSISHFLYSFTSNIEKENKLTSFVIKHFEIKTSNRKSRERFGLKIGRSKIIQNNKISQLIRDYDSNHIINLRIASNVFLNNVLYEIQKNQGRFDNSCVYSNGKIGFIRSIVIDAQKVYFILQELTSLFSLFYDEKTGLKSNMNLALLNENYFVVESDKVEGKYFCFESNDGVCYISFFNTSHLFN